MRWTVLVVTIFLALPLSAEDVRRDDWRSRRGACCGWGVRLGAADDPDQFVFGAEYDFGAFARDVHFEPNVELSFGDDHKILAVAGMIHYYLDGVERVRPFLGGGPVLGLVDLDLPGNDDTELEIALRVGGGARWPLRRHREFSLELLLGFGDLQDAQVMAAWHF